MDSDVAPATWRLWFDVAIEEHGIIEAERNAWRRCCDDDNLRDIGAFFASSTGNMFRDMASAAALGFGRVEDGSRSAFTKRKHKNNMAPAECIVRVLYADPHHKAPAYAKKPLALRAAAEEIAATFPTRTLREVEAVLRSSPLGDHICAAHAEVTADLMPNMLALTLTMSRRATQHVRAAIDQVFPQTSQWPG